MKITAVIPARWASSRFPGKPLALIAGRPMLQRVWERTRNVPEFDRVIVATDDGRIADAAAAFGADVVMTSAHHQSGTDRLAEAALADDAGAYVNVQGDEPLVRSDDLAMLARRMRAEPSLPVASLCHAISAEEALHPDRVKVVRDQHDQALYFSRSPIPYPRNGGEARYFQHVGVYAYRRDVLLDFANLPHSPLEQAESLEQLRLLSAGHVIRMIEVAPTGPGVDSPDDIALVERLLAEEEDQFP